MIYGWNKLFSLMLLDQFLLFSVVLLSNNCIHIVLRYRMVSSSTFITKARFWSYGFRMVFASIFTTTTELRWEEWKNNLTRFVFICVHTTPIQQTLSPQCCCCCCVLLQYFSCVILFILSMCGHYMFFLVNVCYISFHFLA